MINKIARILALTVVMGTALLSYALPMSHKAIPSNVWPSLLPPSAGIGK
jgi:hypothetical protein